MKIRTQGFAGVLVSMTPAMKTKLRIFVEIRNGPDRILMGQGKLIREKTLKSKISRQTPFKVRNSSFYCIHTVVYYQKLGIKELGSSSSYVVSELKVQFQVKLRIKN